MSTPAAGDAGDEGVAQGTGEGGGAQVGVVQGQEAQVTAGHLQGRTRDQLTPGHGGRAPAAWSDGDTL